VMKRSTALLVLTVAGILSAMNVPLAAGNGSNKIFRCGGETDPATVQKYFSDLQFALRHHEDANTFNKFVHDNFSTIKRGRYLRFNLRDVGAVTPSRIGLNDWKSMAERGSAKLEGVGYRGCMFDNGKVWFEGDGTKFKLIGINHDLPWEDISR
jgi:hypothetical protein